MGQKPRAFGCDRNTLRAALTPGAGKPKVEKNGAWTTPWRTLILADNAAAPLIVFDIPLLFEKAGSHGLDAVAVVSAPFEQQRARVLARPGMTAEKFAQILKLQVPDAEKRARADYVIDTSVSLADTARRVDEVIADIRAKVKA